MFDISVECERRIVQMGDMNPFDIGTIISDSNCRGHLVMRTACVDRIEVLDLTMRNPDCCWTNNVKNNGLEVELLPNGSKITLTIR